MKFVYFCGILKTTKNKQEVHHGGYHEIGEVLNRNLETAKFFMEIGMHCLGCPASQGESIEEACMVHGTNADELVAKLNAFLGE